EDFIVLLPALCKFYHHERLYLQQPDEKEAAAELLCRGSLGAEVFNECDNEAKWKWCQTCVDAL
ncbi:hypothetical protein DFH28DRAFT_892002, partial [Melampsora americana]